MLSGRVEVGEADGNHGILGIGPGFIPQTLNREVIDQVFVVNVELGYRRAEEIIKREGILIGVSTGAVMDAAIEIGSNPSMQDKNIVVIAASGTERYLSTKLADNARRYVSELPAVPALAQYIDMLK